MSTICLVLVIFIINTTEIYRMKEPPDKGYYKVIKTNLKTVIKHDSSIDKINNIVLIAHKIIIHTLHFMKLYLIDYYENNESFPKIDKVLITNIMKILCQDVSFVLISH